MLLAVAGALLISGCQSYKTGESRTVGEITDDTAIQLRVKTKLIRDADVNGARMNVEVKKGVVTLLGRVDSQEMKAKALEIAGSVKGVTHVEDRLRIRKIKKEG